MHGFGLVLRLNVPVNNFSAMSGRSHRFLGITSTFSGSNYVFDQRHNTADVDIEPPTSRSGVRGSTTRPPRSPKSRPSCGKSRPICGNGLRNRPSCGNRPSCESYKCKKKCRRKLKGLSYSAIFFFCQKAF